MMCHEATSSWNVNNHCLTSPKRRMIHESGKMKTSELKLILFYYTGKKYKDLKKKELLKRIREKIQPKVLKFTHYI